MTMTEVAALAGVTRASVHKARQDGRLTAHRTQLGDWLVRRTDAYQFHLNREPSVYPQGGGLNDATSPH